MSKQQVDSKKRISFATRLQFGGDSTPQVPEWIQVCPIGVWSHPYFGELKITRDDCDEMVRNFNEGVKNDLPITAGHDNGMNGGELPAVAWYGELKVTDDGLWTKPDWNEEGKELIQSRKFKYFSTEIDFVYRDPATRAEYRHVLDGGALTNRPFFKEMEPVGKFSDTGIMSSNFNFNDIDPMKMEFSEIRTMKASELADEQKQVLIAHKAELSDTEHAEFKEIVGERTAPVVVVPVRVEASEKMSQIPASELERLQADAKAGREASESLKASARASFVDTLMFSQTNAAGKFAVAEKPALEKFVSGLSDEQRGEFGELMSKVQTDTKGMFSELGDGGAPAASATATEQVRAKAQEKIKASEGQKLKLSAAISQVMSEHPELATAYEKEISGE